MFVNSILQNFHISSNWKRSSASFYTFMQFDGNVKRARTKRMDDTPDGSGSLTMLLRTKTRSESYQKNSSATWEIMKEVLFFRRQEQQNPLFQNKYFDNGCWWYKRILCAVNYRRHKMDINFLCLEIPFSTLGSTNFPVIQLACISKIIKNWLSSWR